MAADQDHARPKFAAAADLAALEALRVRRSASRARSRRAEVARVDGPGRASDGSAEDPRAARSGDRARSPTARRRSKSAELERRLATETIDLSLPAPESVSGTVHPVSQVMDELAEIFADLGFSVAEGPEIETHWYNFTALNMPENHPARAMQDTFYLEPRTPDEEPRVLRTHTSPVQIRTMESTPPPIYVIAPGRVYRSDSDATHTPMFHQIEGLVIDRGDHARPSQMDAGDLPQGLLRARRHRAADAPVLFPVHRAVGRGRRRLVDGEGPPRRRRAARLDGGARQRHGPPARHRQLRARSRRMAGLRLRLRHRPAGDAEIRHGRPARLLRRRSPLAASITASARSTCRRFRGGVGA